MAVVTYFDLLIYTLAAFGALNTFGMLWLARVVWLEGKDQRAARQLGGWR